MREKFAAFQCNVEKCSAVDDTAATTDDDAFILLFSFAFNLSVKRKRTCCKWQHISTTTKHIHQALMSVSICLCQKKCHENVILHSNGNKIFRQNSIYPLNYRTDETRTPVRSMIQNLSQFNLINFQVNRNMFTAAFPRHHK